MTRLLLSAMLGFLAVAALISRVWADAPPPIKLNFTTYDSMTVQDCLRVISMETGDIILPDASVNGYVGAVNVSQDNVPDMLNYLKTFEPDLTYQVVYYPNGPNEPDGEQLYQMIQTLTTSQIAGLVLPASGEDNTMLTFRAEPYTTPDIQNKAVAGMREIYLVSDPAVRAQLKKAAATPATMAQPGGFTTMLNTLVQQIAKMTPQQQTAAMAALAAAQRQINQSLDPTVLANMRAGYIPRQPMTTPTRNSAPGANGTMVGQ